MYTADIGTSDAGEPIYINAYQRLTTGGEWTAKKVTYALIDQLREPRYLVKDGMADYNIIFQNQIVDTPFRRWRCMGRCGLGFCVLGQ